MSRTPHTARMNVAAGLAQNGDLLVLCSGWTEVRQPPRPKQETLRDDILQTWVCRSADGGRTWTQEKKFPAPDAGWTEFIPFGDIKPGADGALHVACYGSPWTPNLDRLAAGGTRFTRATCGYPICHVSRAEILTGRCLVNADMAGRAFTLEAGWTTWPDAMRRAGWHTAYGGK